MKMELDDYAAREWQKVIAKLNNWAQNAAQLEDEGLDAPDPDIIQRAIEFATDCLGKGYAAPTSIAPDPNGGIVFELKCEGDSTVFHFWDDGSAEFLRFLGQRLVDRQPVVENGAEL